MHFAIYDHLLTRFLIRECGIPPGLNFNGVTALDEARAFEYPKAIRELDPLPAIQWSFERAGQQIPFKDDVARLIEVKHHDHDPNDRVATIRIPPHIPVYNWMKQDKYLVIEDIRSDPVVSTDEGLIYLQRG